MLYLIASCVALLLGPLFFRYFSSGNRLQRGLDSFIFVSLGGLVLLHILPELLEHGGMLAFLFVVIGVWGPSLSEKLFHQYSEITHNLTLTLGVAGLLLHTLTDGGALVLAQQEGNSSLLALGLIIHRLPVGLAIWWLLRPQIGVKWSSAVLAAMLTLTCIGYFAGEQLLSQLTLENTVYLQAFVTGSILHVVLHQPHAHSHQPKQVSPKYAYAEGVGSLIGLSLLVVLLLMDATHGHHHHGHDHHSGGLFHWALELAPMLLLAYIIAGLRYAFELYPQPQTKNKMILWLYLLIKPEVLVLTLLMLGTEYALLFLTISVIFACVLTVTNVPLPPCSSHTKARTWKAQFSTLIDNSAPWVLFSLVIANLIGHAESLLASPMLQLFVLSILFITLRYNMLGAVVLALSLAQSHWSNLAIMFSLIAPMLIHISLLKTMSNVQRATIAGLIALMIGAVLWWTPHHHEFGHIPHLIGYVALGGLFFLYANSILRQGPRVFLSLIWPIKKHHH